MKILSPNVRGEDRLGIKWSHQGWTIKDFYSPLTVVNGLMEALGVVEGKETFQVIGSWQLSYDGMKGEIELLHSEVKENGKEYRHLATKNNWQHFHLVMDF